MANPRNDERGFVLITAVWLLLLCAGIAAILMLRGIAASKAAKDEGALLREQLALDAATETVIADLIMRGSSSQWATTPSSGMIVMERGAPLDVTVTSESGRLDLNHGDFGVIDLALQRLGYDASQRAKVGEALRERRAAERPLNSLRETESVIAELGPAPEGICLIDLVTVHSAMSKPADGQMPLPLARAFGTTPSRQPLEPGVALRVEARSGPAVQLRTVVRIIGNLDQPYSMMDRAIGPKCG